MVQPAQLLEDFSMIRVLLDDALVGVPRANMLQVAHQINERQNEIPSWSTYVTLLLEDMPNLEPDVGVRKGTGRIPQDAIEALEALGIFALLLVNYPKAEQDLVRLVKV